MPEPVFGEGDRVPTTQLPAELRGVTDPLKIAAYYQKREATIREEARTQQPPITRVTMQPPTDDPPQRPPVDRNAPANLSVAEAESARATLITVARNNAKAGKKYWDRLSNDIEKLMATMNPSDQVNTGVWETAYNSLLGMNLEKLQEEERNSAAEAARISAERSSVPPPPNTPPPPLAVEVTSKILPGLGITESKYREAQEHIAKGTWPLTAENVGEKPVRIGEQK